MIRKTLSLSLFFTLMTALTAWGAPMSVVVFPFDTTSTGQKDLGDQISQIVAASPSELDDVVLVERQSMSKILEEQEINLTGMVDNAKAIQIGKLVGARLMVCGKAFQLGQTINLTAKLIGTETSLVQMVAVTGKADRDLGELVFELAEKIRDKYQAKAASLVAQQSKAPSLDVWKEKFKDKKMPTVVVAVPEEHIARVQAAQADPAVETEIKRMLLACGVTIYEVNVNKLTKSLKHLKDPKLSGEAAKADWIIAGEAFSEFGARIGNLNSAIARVEINIIDRGTGKVIFADRQMARAVDLGENLAGRKALQLAGERLTWRLLEKILESSK